MTVFNRKVNKTWSIKIAATNEAKERNTNIIAGLKTIDKDLSFKLEELLENELEVILSKGEKELAKLLKKAEETREKDLEQPSEHVNSSSESRVENEVLNENTVGVN